MVGEIGPNFVVAPTLCMMSALMCYWRDFRLNIREVILIYNRMVLAFGV